jgi:hypothetical protein
MDWITKNWKLLTSGVLVLAGIGFMAFGQYEIGGGLLVAAGVPYMPLKKGTAALLLTAALVLPTTGCKSHMINVDALEGGLVKVLDRHDAYVKADTSLEDLVKQVYLRSTELIRMILEEAKK